MKDELFSELLESVREGGAILRGEKALSRTFNIEKPDAVLPAVAKIIETEVTSNHKHMYPSD